MGLEKKKTKEYEFQQTIFERFGEQFIIFVNFQTL